MYNFSTINIVNSDYKEFVISNMGVGRGKRPPCIFKLDIFLKTISRKMLLLVSSR